MTVTPAGGDGGMEDAICAVARRRVRRPEDGSSRENRKKVK